MKHIYRVVVLVASATFFYASAQAQNSTTVNHAVPIGKGPGVTGFNSAAPGTAGQPLVSNGASSDPSFKVLPASGGGAGADNSTNAANDVLASNGSNGTFVHTALTTLINAACTITPNLCSQAFGSYSPYWFGAKCDGSTDDTTAIGSAITGAAGGRLLFPAATCVVSNSNALLGGSAYSGINRNLSIIKSTACLPIFTVGSVSNVTIENLWLRGNDACVSWASSAVGAVQGAVPSGGINWTFKSLRLSNFNSNYWFVIAQSSGVFTNLTIDDVVLDSTSADAPGITNSPNIGIQIQSGTLGSRFENTVINSVQVNGTDICLQLLLYSNFYKYSIRNSRFLNAGAGNTNTHCTNGLGGTNSYAIGVYDLNNDGNPPTDGIIEGNYIAGPQASGIYVVMGSALTRAAQSSPLLIANNEFVTQTQSDVLLPRGAIAINAATDITIVGNKFRSNSIGINATGATAGVLTILNNDCYSGAGSSICLYLSAGINGSSNTDNRVVRGNYFDAAANSVQLVSATGSRFNNIDMSGNTIVANTASAGAGLTAASQFVSGMFNLKDNTFLGSLSTAMISISGLTGNLGMKGNTFNTPAGAGGILFANLPAAVNGSEIYVQDGAPASSPCTGSSTGSTAMRQNGAWKCF